MSPTIIFALLIVLQAAVGVTVGAAGGLRHWPHGRWPCLVRRSDEPQVFWAHIVCQVLILGLVAALRE